ncbi:MAG: hypothetical protein ACE37K_22900 [Planctomycetota bacterium]
MRTIAVMVALLMAAVAGAQQRRTCIGTVRDADGAPVAGATVTAVYATAGDASFCHDRQVAVADPRGRFRLQLFAGLTYSYWAIGPERADGTRLVSRLHQGATGGGYFAVAATALQRPRTMQLAGLDAWRRHGAAAVTVHAGPKDVQGVAVAIAADGSGTLPPLPASSCLVVVADGDGAPLVLGLVGPDRATVELGEPQQLTMKYDLAVPEGARLRVHVRAPVVWNEGELWVASDRFFVRDLGVFRDGMQVVIPKRPKADPSNYWWRPSMMTVRAGQQTVARVPLPTIDLQGAQQRFLVDGKALLEPVDARWGVDLGRARDDEPFLCVPVRGDAPWHAVCGGFVTTGRALREGLRLEHHWQSCEVLARGSAGAALERVAVIGPLEADAEPGPPAPLCTVELTVVDDRGGPGREAWVALVPLDQKGRGWADERTWLRADSGGRVRTLLPHGRYGVHATDGRGTCAQELQVGDELVRRQLALAAMPTMTMRVLDGQDQPVPGAAGYSMVHGTVGAVDGLAAQQYALGNSLTYRVFVRQRTDARGQLVVPIPPGIGDGARLRFRLPDGGSTGDVVVEPSDEVVVVR